MPPRSDMPPKRASSRTKAKRSVKARVEYQRAPRLPGAVRKTKIINEAACYFAQHGFSASTRELADAMGVRQALLYRYFANKEALVTAVLKANFDNDWRSRWSVEDATPPAERAGRFLAAHAADQLRLRLFIRAVLDCDYFSDVILETTGFLTLRLQRNDNGHARGLAAPTTIQSAPNLQRVGVAASFVGA